MKPFRKSKSPEAALDGAAQLSGLTSAGAVKLLLLAPAFVTALILVTRRSQAPAGRLMTSIGVLHMLGGSFVGRRYLGRIWRRGLWGEADSGLGEEPDKVPQEMVFWFQLWGYYLVMLGQLVAHVQKREGKAPRFLRLHFTLSTIASAALYPTGGFWWMLIPAYLLSRPSESAERGAAGSDLT